MAVICPTVLASEAHAYREQVERVTPFAKRVHIDVADGVFAPTKTLQPVQLWLPEDVTVDLHIMYKKPLEQIENIISLHPNLVIIHAEAEGNFIEFAKAVRGAGIKTGVALLPETKVKVIKPALEHIDHVLIFSGNLGHFGGVADLNLLEKVKDIKALNPNIEVGWDGGINDKNASKLVAGGVDVLNTGGFIQKADNPEAAYATLKAAV